MRGRTMVVVVVALLGLAVSVGGCDSPGRRMLEAPATLEEAVPGPEELPVFTGEITVIAEPEEVGDVG